MKNTIALDDLKLAAIYSENVLPMVPAYDYFLEQVFRMFSGVPDDARLGGILNPNHFDQYVSEMYDNGVFPDILPKYFVEDDHGRTLARTFFRKNFELGIARIVEHNAQDRSKEYVEQLKRFRREAGSEVDHVLEKLFKKEPFKYWSVQSSDHITQEEGVGDDLILTLTDLNLVRTSKTEWSHILEFRKDKESRAKLLRLRHFVSENYEGKNKNYIEDDLMIRISDHEAACKEWGFEVRRSVLEMAFSSRVLLASTVGGLVSLFVGAPPAAILSASAGLLFESGRIGARLAKVKHENQKLAQTCPVAYLADVKDRFSHSNDT